MCPSAVSYIYATPSSMMYLVDLADKLSQANVCPNIYVLSDLPYQACVKYFRFVEYRQIVPSCCAYQPNP